MNMAGLNQINLFQAISYQMLWIAKKDSYLCEFSRPHSQTNDDAGLCVFHLFCCGFTSNNPPLSLRFCVLRFKSFLQMTWFCWLHQTLTFYHAAG